jgi:hypothetical protein
MTITVLDRAPVTGDAGRVTGERQERPDPEVPERARRRTFTAAYKQELLAAYDAPGRVRRARCCGGRACTPASSPNGAGRVTPGRWPG